MDEHPNRLHCISYGSGVLMVVFAGLVGHFKGGFWWWMGGAAVVGTALVLHGHFPAHFTKTRIGFGIGILALVILIGFTGWVIGRHSAPIATPKEHPIPAPQPVSSSIPQPPAPKGIPSPTRKAVKKMESVAPIPPKDRGSDGPSVGPQAPPMIYAPGGGVSVGQQGGITTGEVTIDASGVIVKVRLDSTAHNDGGAYTFHYTINLTGQVPQFSISSLRGGDRIEVEAGHGAAMGLRVGPQSYGEQNAFGTYSVSLVSTNSDAPKLGIGCQGVRCVLQ